MVDQEKIERGFVDAGWQLDGGFSEHLVIGNDDNLSILANLRFWERDAPIYELYDVERHLSYWVKEVPTPQRAATLMEEHGEPPE